mgnify:CR=1 FL=1
MKNHRIALAENGGVIGAAFWAPLTYRHPDQRPDHEEVHQLLDVLGLGVEGGGGGHDDRSGLREGAVELVDIDRKKLPAGRVEVEPARCCRLAGGLIAHYTESFDRGVALVQLVTDETVEGGNLPVYLRDVADVRTILSQLSAGQ